MNYTEFTEKYKTLVFAPLTLPPPPVTAEELTAWVNDYPDMEFNETKAVFPDLTKEQFHEHFLKEKFYFFDSFRVCEDLHLTGWNPDFIERFPQMKDWIDDLPVPKHLSYTCGWIVQFPKDTLLKYNKPLCSPIHVDEANGFGLRYFINNQRNHLHFYGIKPDITANDILEHAKQNNIVYNYQIHHKLDQDGEPVFDGIIPIPNDNYLPKYQTINTVKDTAFLLGQTHASHFITHEDTDELKFTWVVQPIGVPNSEAYDWDRIDQSLQEIIKTRPEECVWYEDFLS